MTGDVVRAVLRGLFGLVLLVGAVLPGVFLWRRWRRDGFGWWMIPAVLVATYVTVECVELLWYGISCVIMGRPCRGIWTW